MRPRTKLLEEAIKELGCCKSDVPTWALICTFVYAEANMTIPLTDVPFSALLGFLKANESAQESLLGAYNLGAPAFDLLCLMTDLYERRSS